LVDINLIKEAWNDTVVDINGPRSSWNMYAIGRGMSC